MKFNYFDIVFFEDAKLAKLREVFAVDKFFVISETGKIAKESSEAVEYISLLNELNSNKLKKISKEHKVAIFGNSMKACRFAATHKGIDFLLHPIANKVILDVQTARLLAKQNVAIAFLFSRFLECKDATALAKELRYANLVAKIAKRARCNLVVVSGAKNINQLKAPRDLLAFAELIRIDQSYIKESFRRILEKETPFFVVK